MTEREAYKILGISPETGQDEIKKRYRQLMLRVHPDMAPADGGKNSNYAQEINTAYAVLKKKCTKKEKTFRKSKNDFRKEKQNVSWDAPVNIHAYREREILHYAEDDTGTVLGHFCIAKGKYLWKTDEDFSLFQLSLYRCGKRLLDEIDQSFHREGTPASRSRIQAELTYLLAQQFIDGTALLREISKEQTADSEGQEIFYLPAMLEASDGTAISAGEALYPAALRHHRLYIKSHVGKELGYLSFPDDRFYYIVIPLFEQKKVRVKIQAAETPQGKKQIAGKRNSSAGYRSLHLWIKLCSGDSCTMPENVNLQIEKLLETYQRAGQAAAGKIYN